MTLAEIAEQVATLHSEINAYWDEELPKRHRDYPQVRDGEDSGPPPPEAAELRDLLATLPADDLYRIALTADFGRGYYPATELAEHSREVHQQFGPPEVARVLLGDDPDLTYLDDGLAKLRVSGVAIDDLPVVRS